jgi:plastocyanin domain-containing protein
VESCEAFNLQLNSEPSEAQFEPSKQAVKADSEIDPEFSQQILKDVAPLKSELPNFEDSEIGIKEYQDLVDFWDEKEHEINAGKIME